MRDAGGRRQDAGSRRQGLHLASCLLHRASGILLVVFIALGLSYSFVTPLFEGPDETGHYAYVAHVVREKSLPVQSTSPAQQSTYEAHQPPLYYTVGALLTFWIDLSNESTVLRLNPKFVWGGQGAEPNAALHTAAEQFPFRGAALLIHIVRALSVLLGAVTVWAVYQVGKLLTRHEIVAFGAASLVAFNPQFLFISSVINNDNALIAFSTLALLTSVRLLMVGRTRSRLVWLGVWIGLAILSKPNGLALLGLLVFTLAILAWQERSLRAGIRYGLWAAIPVIMISGWWFVRNQWLYGDPLGYQMFIAINGSGQPVDFGRFDSWRNFAEATQRSFWGQFGWMTIPLKRPVYDGLALLYPAAVLGAFVGWAWRRECLPDSQLRAPRQARWALGALLVTLAGWLASAMGYAAVQGGVGFQGRFIYPAIAPIALLMVDGLSAIVPDRWRWLPIGLVTVPLAILAISVPGQYIAPTYRFYTLPESALSSVPHRLDGTFNAEIALAGFDVQRRDKVLQLTLYWRATGTPLTDYKVYIHAMNADGHLCGQQDALPLDGAFPMGFWRAGDVIADPHDISIDSVCWGTTDRRLDVGLYREDTGERLLYSLNGQPVSDHVEIRP